MVNRFVPDWTIEDYFSQSKCDKAAFSYSAAKTLVQKSPKHCYLQHIKLGGQTKERSKSMDIGQAVHTAILGKGDRFIKSPYDDFRTKEVKEWRELQDKQGLIVLKSDDYENIHTIKQHFESQMEECGLWEIFESSQKELIAEYIYNGVYTISMMDLFNDEYGIIMDIKTTTDSSPEACQRKIIDMGYDIQSFLYQKAVEAIKPELTGRVRFFFLFIETDPPYCLTPIELDLIFEAVGEAKLNRAASIWSECLSTNVWPGYAKGTIVLDPPQWHVKKILEEQ